MNIRSYSPGRIPAALERGDIKKQEDKLSESKYTPGPWKVDKTWGLIIGPHNEEIGAIHAAIGVETRRGNLRKVIQETAGANARLIAAAPEMLAALKKMSEAVSLLRDGERNGAAFGMVGIAHDEARETIAKAEGK